MLEQLLVLVLLTGVSSSLRDFHIDYEHNQFVKDGAPYRYISGSIHYNRVPSFYWYDRLSKMKAAGLNAIQTYIFWNFHEEKEGEWDAGGFPYYIYKDRNIKVRTSDPKFVEPVKKWYAELMPRIVPMLYKNGGPIILMQIENEYGSHPDLCNITYTTGLRDLIRTYVGYDSQLITDDGGAQWYLKCGFIPDVYPTVDFGTSNQAGVNVSFNAQKMYAPRGPSVNTEFYPGWLDLWGNTFPTVAIQPILNSMDYMNTWNASINFYMFEGGTNFGFWPEYLCTQTYDYDAPLTEAGDPTPKLTAIKTKIENILGTKVKWPMPPNTKKTAFGTVPLLLKGTLFDLIDKVSPSNLRVSTKYPLTMEDIDFPYGFLMYETLMPSDANAAILDLSGVKDRGHVFIGKQIQGVIVSGKNSSLPVNGKKGQKISILVENMGRRASGYPDLKGIISNVTVGGKMLTNWVIYPIIIDNLFKQFDEDNSVSQPDYQVNVANGFVPSFYTGTFHAPKASDTFFDPSGWNKGYFFINGNNVGKYWPVAGPQVTLYTPITMIKAGTNRIVVFELNAPGNCQSSSCSIKFKDTPYLNKTVNPHETVQESIGNRKWLHKRNYAV